LLVRTGNDVVAAALSGFEASASADGVRMEWNASPEIEGFLVWRSQSSAGPWEAVTATPLDATQRGFADAPAAGVSYYRVDGLIDGGVRASTGPYRVEIQPSGYRLALRAERSRATGETAFHFSIPASLGNSYVTLSIFDVTGRRVATVFNGAVATGQHVETWNGRTESGARAASGAYFARLETRNT